MARHAISRAPNEFIACPVVRVYDRAHFTSPCGLYAPSRLASFLHEQRLSVQACFTSGLLLPARSIWFMPRIFPAGIVLVTVGLVTVALSLRRLVYRMLLYRRFDRGVGTRNVLIVGTGPEAHALRHHLESIRHLGYTFKGFIDFPGSGSALDGDFRRRGGHAGYALPACPQTVCG